ncbi:MAG: diphosphomevalonate decarboxylase [Coxiella sp. RIFCSPHIGHO2_12_FULL_42_15]|nr:MAG: diphosphomevalonate decarboxylase [Coxiella sp. RIFCSPHIGHO2_12_FULL_42_15]
MLSKKDVVENILAKKNKSPAHPVALCFAPSNIALAKYWGKRNTELNLPMNSSLSISLQHRGATAQLEMRSISHKLIINDEDVDLNSQHGQRLCHFLDLFQFKTHAFYQVRLNVNIPFAAGLASSACVFASLVLALNQLHQWQLTTTELSILSRLGSGSAARSVTTGFVEWHAGRDQNGMDSFAEKIPISWPDFCIGLCIYHHTEKSVSSREGMQRTVATSPLYDRWPSCAEQAVQRLKIAIAKKDITLLGETAENNALTMHATMLSAWPPLLYSTTETITGMQHVWQLRTAGIPVYFTQDAGPNLKILSLKEHIKKITPQFPHIEWAHPFD